MEEPSGSKHKIGFSVGACEASLAPEVPHMNRNHGGIIFEGVVYSGGIAQGCIWVEKMI